MLIGTLLYAVMSMIGPAPQPAAVEQTTNPSSQADEVHATYLPYYGIRPFYLPYY